MGQGGAERRLRTEQAPEGEVVDDDIRGFADVVVDLGKATLDFLVAIARV